MNLNELAKLRYYLNSQKVEGIIEGKRNSDIIELMIGRKIDRLVKTHLGKLPFVLNLPHHFVITDCFKLMKAAHVHLGPE